MGQGRFVRRTDGVVWTGDRRHATDDELVGAARRGDPEAFTLLYHRYKLDVWQLAWFTLHDHHEAEDALQETFLKAHRAIGQRHGAGSVRPWLLAICRNACRDRLRSGHRREALPLDEALAIGAGDDGAAERDLDFRAALRGLSEEDREAFLLVDVLGCHSDEAARIAGVAAPSTLRSRVARARRALAPLVAEAPEVRTQEHVWGVLHSVHHSVIVVASSGAGPAPGAGVVDGGAVADLLSFLDDLDRRIPTPRSVLAVVDDRPPGRASVAAPWLAGHPRWRMQRAPTHASWLDEVDVLLRGRPASAPTECEALRDRLASGMPFMWMCGA